MRSHWLIVDVGTESDLRHRRPGRVSMHVPRVPCLQWLAIGTLLLSSGCITPCWSGACNSSQPLYVSPMARFGSVEKKLPDACLPAAFCKPFPYFTFGKYWPKLDEWHTTSAALKCARKSLRKQMWETKRWINAHYRDGYAQAFIDVANGGNGELPAVPPPRYWNAHFRSPKGEWRVERWFDGYRAGAAVALVQMQPLRRISASYDWSIEKPKAPFVSSPMGPGNYCGVPGGGPYMQTGGFGPPRPQGFPGQTFGPQGYPAQPVPYNGFPQQSMAPGYGNTPIPPGQSGSRYGPPGTTGPPNGMWGNQPPIANVGPSASPGGLRSGIADPGLAPGRTDSAGPPAQQFQTNPPSTAAQPGASGLVPGYGAGPHGQVGNTPGRGPARPAPQGMTPGFS